VKITHSTATPRLLHGCGGADRRNHRAAQGRRGGRGVDAADPTDRIGIPLNAGAVVGRLRVPTMFVVAVPGAIGKALVPRCSTISTAAPRATKTERTRSTSKTRSWSSRNHGCFGLIGRLRLR